MKPRAILFLCLVVFGGLLARADEADARLDAANRAYQDGHYDVAATTFTQLIAERGYSAPLCFDLGNAELKAGHFGPALLNYERARYLAPGDAGIEHNLQQARKQAGLAPDPYRWWQVALLSINWAVWAGIIVTCLFLLLVALVGSAYAEPWAARTGKSTAGLRRLFKGIAFVGLPVLLFFCFVELSAIGLGARVQAVIVTKQAALRLSPFESAEQTGTLPEGELVTVEQHHDDYYWVDDRSRQSGWVQEKALEPVLPGELPGTGK